MEDHWKFQGGGGIIKTKLFKGMCEPKVRISGGGGWDQTQKSSIGSMDIFWNITLQAYKSCYTALPAKGLISPQKIHFHPKKTYWRLIFLQFLHVPIPAFQICIQF